ncbi:MAG: 5-formyltetrahydrofolate cyclo-ligase [Phycisphaerae bacterium]|nr:5-formyltetrahydrofolate cyclo-ligase [Phycisphaerae bacterium]
MDKEQMRRMVQKRLVEITPEQRVERSKEANLLLVSTPEFQNASTIMMFLSLPREIDTAEAILRAWQMGKTVVVPKVSWQQRHMMPVKISSLETGLATDQVGLRNPVNGTPIPFGEIDLVVTPGLAFDKEGNRLGRGGSYYDKFFQNKELTAHRCALAFEEQLVDKVPVTEMDQKIHSLVTDKHVLYFNRKGKPNGSLSSSIK